MGNVRLSDPRILWAGLVLVGVTITLISKPLALMLLMASLVTLATQPLVGLVWSRTKLSYGASAGLTVTLFVTLIGLALWFAIPLLVNGVRELLHIIPKNAEQLQWLLQIIKDELEGIMPASAIDEFLQKLKDIGAGRSAASLSAHTAGKLAAAAAHFLLFVVFYVLMLLEWSHITEWTSSRFQMAFPNQTEDAHWLAACFQSNLASICRAVVRIMAVFAPVYALLFWVLGVSAGKSALYGLVFGALGGIPVIGGILMYLPMWTVGFLELVWPTFVFDASELTSPEMVKWGLLIGGSILGHVIEAKAVTPLILGHHLKLAAIAILVPLATCAIGFGLTKGIVLGFSLIALAKAWDDLVVEKNKT